MTPFATPLPGVLRFAPAVHGDDRGSFVETWSTDWPLPDGTHFVRDARSTSTTRHTLRGLHAQKGLGKLIGVSFGRVFDVVVDLRAGSPTIGQFAAFELDAGTADLLWIPAGCAHGFLTLSEVAVVTYRMTTGWVPEDEVGVRWDDEALGIPWPARPVVISERDARLPGLRAVLGG